MSLINSMLADLSERRGGVPLGEQAVLADLSAVREPPAPAPRLLPRGLSIALLFAAGLLAATRWPWQETIGVVQAMAEAPRKVASEAVSTPPQKESPLPSRGERSEGGEADRERGTNGRHDVSTDGMSADKQTPSRLGGVVIAPEPAVPESTPAPASFTGAEVTHIAVEREAHGAAFRLRLSAPAPYNAQRDPVGGARVELRNARLAEGHTQAYDGGELISAVRVERVDTDVLAFSFAMAEGTRLERTEITAEPDGTYALVVHCRGGAGAPAFDRDLIRHAAAAEPAAAKDRTASRDQDSEPPRQAPASAEGNDAIAAAPGAARTDAVSTPLPGLRKTVAEPSAADARSLQLQSALTELAQGDRDHALAMLEDLLGEDETQLDARLAAAAALMEAGRLAEARPLLERGLALNPNAAGLNALYGRVLAEQGDLPGAIDRLQRAAPPAVVDPDYHALLAALLQRAARHDEAAMAYRRCLAARPDNGVWWMGLGISLAAAGEPAGAVDAFRRALADATLSPQLRRYAAERVSELKRMQG